MELFDTLSKALCCVAAKQILGLHRTMSRFFCALQHFFVGFVFVASA